MDINDIRSSINIYDESELKNDVIQLAINESEALIESKADPSAPERLIWLAKLRLASYYAYLSYSDRIFNELPGTFTSTGEWNPIGPAIWRETRDKLDKMERAAKEALKLIGIDLEEDKKPNRVPVFGIIR